MHEANREPHPQGGRGRVERVRRHAHVRRVSTAFGGVDFLINNAGIQIPSPSHELSLDDFEKVLHVNLVGDFICARAAIEHFLAENKPGANVNVRVSTK